MDKENNKRLTIDLRKNCDFSQSPIPMRFRIAIIGYYCIVGLLVLWSVYAIAGLAIAKQNTAAIQVEEIRLMSQIRAIRESTNNMQVQIQKANKLIEWQFDDIHGQKLLHTLFSGLAKEVLLEKFSFKRDLRNHQAMLLINLKGEHRELHDEFEGMLSNLESIGLRLITLNQSEISGGMHLQCNCQMNSLQNNKR